MADIIQFPSLKNDAYWSLRRLVDLAYELDELFEDTERLRIQMEKYEWKAQQVQEDYDLVLKRYVDEVGIDKIEAVMLQYSPTAIVECDMDNPEKFTIRWGESKTFPLEDPEAE